MSTSDGKLKRPKNAYFRFQQECYQDIKKQNPEKTAPEISKLISAEYKKLPEERRAKYENDYKKDLERFHKEKGKSEPKDVMAKPQKEEAHKQATKKNEGQKQASSKQEGAQSRAKSVKSEIRGKSVEVRKGKSPARQSVENKKPMKKKQ